MLLNQVHSNKFSLIDKKYKFNKKKLKGDALITSINNVAIGVLTADCVPILIYDQKLKIISAIHAGWKGAYKGIINKVIKFLIKKKTYFGLNKYVYNQLKKIGIKNLEIINKDTFDQKNNFFSSRRSIQNKENDYGRNISIIMIK